MPRRMKKVFELTKMAAASVSRITLEEEPVSHTLKSEVQLPPWTQKMKLVWTGFSMSKFIGSDISYTNMYTRDWMMIMLNMPEAAMITYLIMKAIIFSNDLNASQL